MSERVDFHLQRLHRSALGIRRVAELFLKFLILGQQSRNLNLEQNQVQQDTLTQFCEVKKVLILGELGVQCVRRSEN